MLEKIMKESDVVILKEESPRRKSSITMNDSQHLEHVKQENIPNLERSNIIENEEKSSSVLHIYRKESKLKACTEQHIGDVSVEKFIDAETVDHSVENTSLCDPKTGALINLNDQLQGKIIVLNVPTSDVKTEVKAEYISEPSEESCKGASVEEVQYIQNWNPLSNDVKVELAGTSLKVNIEIMDEKIVPLLEKFCINVSYSCKSCPYMTPDPNEIIVHASNCSINVPPVKDLYDSTTANSSCDNNGCDFIESKITLKEIIKNEGSEMSNVKLEECNVSQSKVVNAKYNGGKPLNLVQKIPELDLICREKYFCKHCPITILYSQDESLIHTAAHSSASSFLCSLCMTSSQKWSAMRNHLSLKHKEINFKIPCDVCQQTFQYHHQAVSHSTSHIKICQLNKKCSFKSVHDNDMNIHVKCHIDKSLHFKCCICGYHPRQNGWNRIYCHIVTVHSETMHSSFQCSACSRGFQDLARLQSHMDLCIRSSVQPMQLCPVCDTLLSLDELDQHMNGHCQEVENPTVKQKRFSQWLLSASQRRCLLHMISFVSDDEFHEHIAMHSTHQVCHDCGENIQRDLFASHIRLKHVMPERRQRYQSLKRCHLCYKYYTTSERLKSHMEVVHSSERMQKVKCTQCSKYFRNKVQLRNHVRTIHEGRRRQSSRPKYIQKLICDQCGYATPSLARLRHHVQAHHQGVYPFQCSFCTYGTKERSDMQRHTDRHAGIKRFECSQCQYRTNLRWLLVKHAKRRHDIELPSFKEEQQTRIGPSIRGKTCSMPKRHFEVVYVDKRGNQYDSEVEQHSLLNPQSKDNCSSVVVMPIKN